MRSDLRVAVIARSVLPLHGYGGLERHVNDLVRHLLANGAHVTLVTRPPDPDRDSSSTGGVPPLEHPNLALQFVPYRTFPLAGRRGTTILDRSTAYLHFGMRAGEVAARLALEQRIDVVHGLGASALGYARARQKVPRPAAPFIFNPQGLEEFGAGSPPGLRVQLKRLLYRPLQAAVRVCARAADRVIATDRSLESSIFEHLHVDRARMRLVPNGVDLDICDRLAGPEEGLRVRAHHAFDSSEPILLSVGRLEESKGFHVLARALAGRAHQTWRWVLVGDGPFRARLEREIDRAGLRSRVQLLGSVTDEAVHAWYEAAAVFVHPTLYEGSSLATLEAMAHRRAVVATSAGGLPDKVNPGVTGWLVPPGQPSALSNAIADALANPARAERMGAEGRALVEREFGWSALAPRILDLYTEVLAERASV